MLIVTLDGCCLNKGGGIFIDQHLMSSAPKLFQRILRSWRGVIRDIFPQFSQLTKPFFVVYVVCPVRSYDILIAPKKDNVRFECSNEGLFRRTMDGALRLAAENHQKYTSPVRSRLQIGVVDSKCWQLIRWWLISRPTAHRSVSGADNDAGHEERNPSKNTTRSKKKTEHWSWRIAAEQLRRGYHITTKRKRIAYRKIVQLH